MNMHLEGSWIRSSQSWLDVSNKWEDTKMNKIRLLALFVVLFVTSLSLSAGETYTLGSSFTATNNPNGVWTYGHYIGGMDKSSFQPFSSNLDLSGNVNCDDPNNVNIRGWKANQLDPSILKNFDVQDVYCPGYSGLTFRASSLVFGPYLGPTVARFTVPSDGSWQVDATFATVQLGNHPPAAYIHNGRDNMTTFELVSPSVPDYFTSGSVGYSQLLSDLSMGDTVDFIVWGNNYHNKSTEVTAIVSKSSIKVDVDIKPFSNPNSINLCSGGVVPVAILGSSGLDVYDIETTTLKFADAGVKVVGKKDKQLCSIEDINGDGISDLICQFLTMDISAIDGSSVSAYVNGSLLGGIDIEGVDSVNIVKDTCE